jgi:hypothetical protein
MIIADVGLFTNILDGGVLRRCECGHIQRWNNATIGNPLCRDVDSRCARCARPWESQEIDRVSESEYRASRQGA